AFAEVHAPAIRRTTYALSTNHAGIFHTQTIGTEHIPATEAGGVDVDQYRAVLRLWLTEIPHHRRGIAFGNDGSTHDNLLLCLVVQGRHKVEHIMQICLDI